MLGDHQFNRYHWNLGNTKCWIEYLIKQLIEKENELYILDIHLKYSKKIKKNNFDKFRFFGLRKYMGDSNGGLRI